MKKTIFWGIFAIFVLGVGGAYWLFADFLNNPVSANATEVIYEVMPGMTFRSVARDLQHKGLIRNAELFVLFAKLKGEASHMKVGEYGLAANQAPADILATLVSGKSLERKVTFAEGLSIFEMADVIQEVGLGKREVFLKLVRDPQFIEQELGEKQSSLEGYLFPETYAYTKFTDLKELVHAMVNKFKEVYEQVGVKSSLQGWSRHQIVTLASIVEKETGAPQERPLIAAVFHNRLRIGMMLQTDPTIIYGKAMETGSIEINITRADLTRQTEYNTYTFKGLPPGPIANPGREALLAAVRPATTKYLFFVSHNDGTHEFSEDYKAHQKAVQKYQLDPKAREGKSWRDLNKKAGN